MRALILSAYHTDSHRHWAEGLMAEISDGVEWTLLSLPGRHFPWRIRGNPISWMQASDATLMQSFDTVIATSMVDLSTLIGLYPHLGSAHKVVYFHENQFAYPLAEGQQRRTEPLMVGLYSAMAADRVLFNSRFNQSTFLDGAWDFLRRMPERVDRSVIDRIERKSTVIPVPLAAPTISQDCAREPGLLLWNHRWEYDKNPEAFFAACRCLKAWGIDFKLAVVGQTFRQQPPAFAEAEAELAEHIAAWGFQSRPDYERLLQRADIVVSTAVHEFQGLSVMEAVRAGCLPIVPSRLCYPEQYAEAYRYAESPELLAGRLAEWLTRPESRPLPPDMVAWEWSTWRSAYRQALTADQDTPAERQTNP